MMLRDLNCRGPADKTREANGAYFPVRTPPPPLSSNDPMVLLSRRDFCERGGHQFHSRAPDSYHAAGPPTGQQTPTGVVTITLFEFLFLKFRAVSQLKVELQFPIKLSNFGCQLKFNSLGKT